MERERVILHCDLNNFYASVECRYQKELQQVPMAVTGSEQNRHGVVLAKNELAKAKGVRTGETVWQARKKCPELVTVRPHFDRYYAVSRAARAIYARYTDRIEPFGIDECWLDVTESQNLFGNGEEIAQRLRKEIRQELDVTISVGVSFNKVFAKLGSDLKKPDAVTVISRQDYREKLWQLPVEHLLGVGKAMLQHLWAMGVTTIGELAQTDRMILRTRFGKNGETLWLAANGMDKSTVALMQEQEEVKSIGHSFTCPQDLTQRDEVWKKLMLLAESVSRRLREKGLCAGGVAVTIRDSRFQYQEHTRALELPCRSAYELAAAAMQAFDAQYRWQSSVRAIGLRAVHLIEEQSGGQLSFYQEFSAIQRHEQVDSEMDSLRKKYGAGIIRRAVLMGEEYKQHGTDAAPMPTFHSK